MADKITLELEGAISLQRFVEAMERFHALVDKLTREVTPGAANVRWVVDFLEAGSATATVRGEGAAPVDVENVVRAWERLGEAAELGQPVPFSPSVQVEVEQLTAMLNGEVTTIRFNTEDALHTVTAPPQPDMPPLTVATSSLESVGAVTGRIETLAHRAMRFSLYEMLDDKRVNCFLRRGQEPLVDRAWGRLAVVTGTIRRDARSGQPVAVRDITDVTLFDEPDREAWRRTAGIAPAPPGAPLPEETIRQLRDDG